MFHSDWDIWMSLDGQVWIIELMVWMEMGKRAFDRLSISWCVQWSSVDPREKDVKREEAKSQTIALAPTTILNQLMSEDFGKVRWAFILIQGGKQVGWPFSFELLMLCLYSLWIQTDSVRALERRASLLFLGWFGWFKTQKMR